MRRPTVLSWRIAIEAFCLFVAFTYIYHAIEGQVSHWQESPSVLAAVSALSFLIASALAVAVTLSRRGAILMIVGTSMNYAVVISNNGYMPIVGPCRPSGMWVCATSTHHLLWLADRSDIFLSVGWSLGDVAVLIGVLVVVFDLTRRLFCRKAVRVAPDATDTPKEAA